MSFDIRRLFAAPGLTGESYYRTRRADLRGTLVVLCGIAAALYIGATDVMRLVGIPSLGPTLGMSDYMFTVIVYAAGGAIAGAIVSWPVGGLWEIWHRRRRKRRNGNA